MTSTIGLHRTDDHSTSEHAAKKVVSELSGLQRDVLRVMKMCVGVADHELNALMVRFGYKSRKESTYRKRRTELTDRGYLEWTGEKRDGHKVWGLTSKGLTAKI